MPRDGADDKKSPSSDDSEGFIAVGKGGKPLKPSPAAQLGAAKATGADGSGGLAAPAGETWSGHSLRKGAASGAGAIDVALFRICYMGGWSIRSAAVHDYIDATCPDTPAARRFFGWLSRR